MRRRTLRTLLPGALLPCLLAAPLTAGPLTPPGPPAPTTVTLNELDAQLDKRIAVNSLPGSDTALHVIMAPGSYYLNAEIAGVKGKGGIEIGAGNVSIDLNGFRVVGEEGTTVGIFSIGGGTTLRNGSVVGWEGGGIKLFAGPAVIECLNAQGNQGTGMDLPTASVVRASSAIGNAGFGFTVDGEAAFENCIARLNADTGFRSGDSSYTGCLALSNGGDGFAAGGTLSNCTAVFNTRAGFALGDFASITECVARKNLLNGIVAGNRCSVRGNLCVQNGSGNPGEAGIRAELLGSTIDGNTCSLNATGISVTGTNNVVIRNACNANSLGNFSIGAGNTDATVITPGAGFSGTDPFANIAY